MRRWIAITFLLFLGSAAFLATAQIGNPGAPSGGASDSNVFIASTKCSGNPNCIQWVNDDSTDNCTSLTTTWLNSINAYSGPATPQVFIVGSGNGKAFKFATANCELFFSGAKSPTVHLWATLDCAQTASFCIGFGQSSQASIIATEQPYLDGSGGVLFGGANLTTAGIYVEPGVNIFNIQGIALRGPQGGTTNGGFGANNSTLGSCTNYGIFVDTPVGSGVIGHVTVGVSSTSTTSGGCGISNPAGSSTGSNTVYIENSTIAASGNAGGSGSCGSQGIIDGGSYGTIIDNNIYGFGVPIRLQGLGHRISNNQISSAQCSAHSVNAGIQVGATSSSTAVGPLTVDANIIQLGTTQSTNLLAIAGDSTGTLFSASVYGNQNYTGNSLFTPGYILQNGMACTPDSVTSKPCSILNNTGFNQNLSNPIIGSGWTLDAPGEYFKACNPSNCTSSTANVGAITLFTAPTNSAIPLLVQCSLFVTTKATTSATVPSCVVTWTDINTGSASSVTLPPLTSGGSNPATGGYPTASALIIPSPSTNVQLATTGYASTGVTPMAYFSSLRGIAQ